VDYFVTSGGVDIGGGSGFEAKQEDCRLEVVETGLLDLAEQVRSYMSYWYKIGLFVNDREPKIGDVIGDYEEATFSGYSGMLLMGQFSAPAMSGVKARTFGPQVGWTHNGGPIANAVYGYFVVRNDGELAWAERFCDGPVIVDRAGRKVNIIPVFCLKNWQEED